MNCSYSDVSDTLNRNAFDFYEVYERLFDFGKEPLTQVGTLNAVRANPPLT